MESGWKMDEVSQKIIGEVKGVSDPNALSEKAAQEYKILKTARDNIVERAELQEEDKKLDADLKKVRRELAAAKKEMESRIDAEQKRGRQEACSELAIEVNSLQKNVENLAKERALVKQKNISDRIARETEALYIDNDVKKSEIADICKEDSLPLFCKNRLYYALFAPKGLYDLLILICTQIVAFGIIPLIIYLFIRDRRPVHLLFIYIGAVVLFGGIYMLLFYFTKIKHADAIKQARGIYNEIRKNKRQIKNIEASIRGDKDESGYDFGDVDIRLQTARKELEEKTAQLEAAKAEFENVTKEKIRADIEAENKDRLDSLVAETNKMSSDKSRVQKRLDKLDEEYKAVVEEKIPKDFRSVQKLNKLVSLFEMNAATTIDSAVLIVKSNRK